MALSTTQIQQLYTAYLGRPADRAGLDYWQEQNVSLADLRANLASDAQPEYVEMYGDRSRAELVEAVYQNMFGRAADAEGLDYWVNGGGASVPAGDLQQLFIEAASTADRAAFNAQVAEDESGIEQPEPPTDTTDITFNTSTTGDAADIFGIFEVNAQGGLTQVARPETAAAFDQQQITSIGKAEWDAAGRVVTTSDDYTFNMSNQLGSAKEYSGLFLSPLLTSESRTTNSQLFVELLDIRAAGTDSPLGNLPIDGIRFQVDGETVVLRSDAIFEAQTYPQLLNAVREAIAANEDLAGFRADIGSSFTATDGGQPIPGAVGSTIVLSDSQGREITGGSFTYSDQVTGGFTLYGDLSTDAPDTVRDLIATNLDLDNVGYGSQGGSINLAGESRSDKGVEQFNVEAKNGVWLTRLESETVTGTHALKEVNVDGTGYFRVGIQADQNVIGLQELMNSVNLRADAGLVDVQNFNGQNLENGDVRLNAFISEEVITRDLQAADTQDDPSFENQTYTYQTAGGDDQISLVVSEELLSRADAQVFINAGNGNNIVETAFVTSAAALTNQQLNGNINIVTGSGNDVVRTWGAGDVVISTGAGDDVIYADNSGLMVADATAWQFNSANTGNVFTTVSNSDAPLSAGGNGVAQTFSANYLSATVSFLGFESTVNVPFTEGQTTALQINQALKNAINNDPVLQHLLLAEDGNGNILNVESLVDGAYASQLNVSFATRTDLPNGSDPAVTTDVTAIETIYGFDGATGSAEVPTLDGVASNMESDNVINAGNGFDVVVLGTGQFSNDTVVFEGTFGTNNIVNFTDGAVLGGTSGGTPPVAEVQNLDLSGATLADTDTVTFTIGTETVTFTNTTGVALTGADLVSAIATDLGTATVGAAGDYTFTQDGTTATTLVVNQAAGNESDIADITAADGGATFSVTGTQEVQGNPGTGATGANGGDILDFSSYLQSVDANDARIATTLNSNDANSVNVLDFTGTADDTFADMTAADFVAALNGDGAYGNLAAQTGVTEQGDYIFMVQDSTNEGQYKVFNAFTNDGGAEFASANLVGVVDFGAEQTFDASNFA